MSNKIFFFCFSILYFWSSNSAFAVTISCRQTDVSIIKNKNSKISSEMICFDETKLMLISKACYENKPCEIFSLAKGANTKSIKINIGPIGTPNFLLCHAAHGFPEIISFKWNNKQHSVSRCLAKKDGSFIDTETFFRILNSNL